MDFSIENNAYDKLLSKAGITGDGPKVQFSKVLIPFAVCWLPLAIITLLQNNFWTGDTTNSFITSFDTQARFLISMPILILAEKIVTARLGLILGQFVNSGIIIKEERAAFDEIINRKMRFLRSNWTKLAILAFCYIHVFLVIFYESEYTSSMLSWQTKMVDGETMLNFAGKWSVLISRPFILYLFYRWFLGVFVWGLMLRKISSLNLNLFAVHPDLAGGLGFVGYAVRYFSPFAFAISATVAGNMADLILLEGFHLDNLKYPFLGYIIFITLLFTIPLLSFTSKLVKAREESIFENNDFANGIFRELRKKFAKGYEKVNEKDLLSPAFSAAGDLSAVLDNALKMKFVPFTIKDIIPLWITTAIPFLAVIVLEIPASELFDKLISFLV